MTDELRAILEAHQRWVQSEGKEGTRADLVGIRLPKAEIQEVDLRQADLREADLQGANFANANLQGADLSKANLRWATLAGAKLQQARLVDTVLRDANLREADLTEVTGLGAAQLGGSDVFNAKLPDAIRDFGGLKNVEELSQSARTLFVSILGGCLYSWLTIATTIDARLLTNSSSSPLPIIQTPIPIAGFYWVAPLLLLCLYFYFHLSLQRLWEGLADLPAVFPDGKHLDKRAYPWLLNGLVRTHLGRLRAERLPLFRLQAVISSLLAWWAVPATLVLFWVRYLPRHDWHGTGFQIVLLTISTVAAVAFKRLAAATLRGEDTRPLPWKETLTRAKTYRRVMAALGTSITFFILSGGAIGGGSVGAIGGGFPFSLLLFYIQPGNADLFEVDVSTKPPNWTGLKQEEIALVKGAPLKGADLRDAIAYGAFLVNADLRWADLRHAGLGEADLRGANLQKANLQKADLRGAYLAEADLAEANLRGADLRSAIGLTAFQVKAAYNWERAFYDKHFLPKVGLSPDHNDRLARILTERGKKERKASVKP